MRIRIAKVEDAEELLDIYTPYVESTAISFEHDVPSIEEFRNRIETTLKTYPYLVVLNDEEQIMGYCYASQFKGRPSYDWAVETSIYVKKDARGAGYGRALYEELEVQLKRQHITNVNACIAYTEQDNEYLTNASMYFHERLGYTVVGVFHKSGYKFTKWFDVMWMEKLIEHHESPMPAMIPFSQLL